MDFLALIQQPSTAQFCCELAAVLGGASSHEEKAKAVGSNLKLLLNAKSYRNSMQGSSGQTIGSRLVPQPIRVKIWVAGQVVYGNRQHNEVQPVGPDVEFNCGNPATTMQIQGATKLFEEEPGLRDLCDSCAKLLFQETARSAPLHSQPMVHSNGSARTKLRDIPSFEHEHSRFISWRPMAEAFGLLEREFSTDAVQRMKLRWAWVSNGDHPTTERQYIYLVSSSPELCPKVLNTNGAEGLIHSVLNDHSPQILWDYASNQTWALSPEIKAWFMKEANANLFPHMMYMPMLNMDRLAAQLVFGPQDDVVTLFAAAKNLVNMAPIALLAGFQKLIFESLLNVFYDSLPVQQNRYRATAQMREVIKFAIESCPVPLMNIEESPRGMRFVQSPSSGRFGESFADKANDAIVQAFDLIETVSQKESFRRFGSTMMTVVHTHKRPLQQMRLYVDTVANLLELTPKLIEKTSAMRRDIDRSLVFVKLDIEAHRAVFDKHDVISASTPSRAEVASAARDVLEILFKVAYDPTGLNNHMEWTISDTLHLRDPVHGQRIKIQRDADGGYPAAAGPITLVIAELIDNAAKYYYQAVELVDVAVVDVSFLNARIVIANQIALGDKLRVKAKLDQAEKAFSGSLNRAMQWATLAGFELTAEFSTETCLQFVLTFYEQREQ